MVIRKLLVLFLVLVICVGPVSADYNISGYSMYSYGGSTTYDLNIPESGHSSPAFTYDAHILIHDFTNAQILNNVIFYDYWTNTLSISRNDASYFVATVDGIEYATGYVTISGPASSFVDYTIDFASVNESYASTLTGDLVISLSFNDDILSSLSKRYTGTRYAYAPNSVYPTMFYTTTDKGFKAGTVFSSYSQVYLNDYDYSFNSTTNISTLSVDKGASSSKWNVMNLTDSSYFAESTYSLTDFETPFLLGNGVKVNVSYNSAPVGYDEFIIDYTNIGYDEEEDEEEDDFEYNITTDQDEYSPGDTVNVTYTTDQKGTIQVVKTISGDIYHSIGFVSGATNATWQFYIAENEPYGFYDVYLLDSSNSILDSVRYSLLPTTSSLDILQSSVDLHETFVVFAQTVNESILSIEDPDGVEVWNESIGALMYDYIYYTPTIKTGIYTAYLYDDATLNDTVMVYLADPPIIDDPLDPETNGTIPIEDVLEDDESMTEYFDDKFREFAPTAWGIFLLAIVLWLMAILSSFGGSGKRR